MPLLTDQLAPVENLLNPITNQSHITWERRLQVTKKWALFQFKQGLITFVLPVIISLIWILYMQNIWGRNTGKI